MHGRTRYRVHNGPKLPRPSSLGSRATPFPTRSQRAEDKAERSCVFPHTAITYIDESSRDDWQAVQEGRGEGDIDEV